MNIVAVVARGDLLGIVRYNHVWIDLLAMVRDVGCCALRKFFKGTMAAEAGFGSWLFRHRRGRSRKGRGPKHEHGQAAE